MAETPLPEFNGRSQASREAQGLSLSEDASAQLSIVARGDNVQQQQQYHNGSAKFNYIEGDERDEECSGSKGVTKRRKEITFPERKRFKFEQGDRPSTISSLSPDNRLKQMRRYDECLGIRHSIVCTRNSFVKRRTELMRLRRWHMS